MLKPRVASHVDDLNDDPRALEGGGLPFVLRFPGGVKGVNGPCVFIRVRDAPSVTGEVNGVEGGTRFGSLVDRERDDDALWAELCVPGSVKGAGSKGRSFCWEEDFLTNVLGDAQALLTLFPAALPPGAAA